jgi:hypothetical protein
MPNLTTSPAVIRFPVAPLLLPEVFNHLRRVRCLVERVTALVDEPWDAVVMPPGDDPAYRMTVFGSGYGLLRTERPTQVGPPQVRSRV